MEERDTLCACDSAPFGKERRTMPHTLNWCTRHINYSAVLTLWKDFRTVAQRTVILTNKENVHMKYVYLFHEGNAQMKSLLGGKGANLAEMTNIGLPVPFGMTISTDACRDYYAHGGKLPGLVDEVMASLAKVE